jgi:hypothetical protein
MGELTYQNLECKHCGRVVSVIGVLGAISHELACAARHFQRVDLSNIVQDSPAGKGKRGWMGAKSESDLGD